METISKYKKLEQLHTRQQFGICNTLILTICKKYDITYGCARRYFSIWYCVSFKENQAYLTNTWRELKNYKEKAKKIICQFLSGEIEIPEAEIIKLYEPKFIIDECLSFALRRKTIKYCINNAKDSRHISAVIFSLENSIYKREIVLYLLNLLDDNEKIKIWQFNPFWVINKEYKMISAEEIKKRIILDTEIKKEVLKQLNRSYKNLELLDFIIK